jgi:NMD protein affecting ribosome stability and mRNA decay
MNTTPHTSKRRNRLRERGLCVDCGRSSPRTTSAFCQVCHEKRLATNRARAKKPPVSAEPISRVDRMVRLAFVRIGVA